MPKPKNIDWDNEPLGKELVDDMAKRLKCSITAVRHAHKVRGIEPFYKDEKAKRKNIDWDNEPLGKESIDDMAKRLKCSRTAVSKAHKVRGIEPLYKNEKAKHKNIDWDNQPLGKMSDRMLAKKLGCSTNTVSIAREARGKKAYTHENPDGPNQFNSSPKGIDWTNVPLGVEPLRVTADRLGCSVPMVAYAHKIRGIKPFNKSLQKGINWEDPEIIALLGNFYDHEVADYLECTESTVRRRRKKLGIPSLDEKEKAERQEARKQKIKNESILRRFIGLLL